MRHRRMVPILAIIAQAACGGAARQEGVVAAPAAAAAPAHPILGIEDYLPDLLICVVQDGELRLVRGRYEPRRGDTLVDGRPFPEAYPDTAGYAGAAAWYVRDEPIIINGRRHVKYGVPRHLLPDELARAGEYRGVPVFVQAGAPPTSDIKYVPVRPGCEFQPYDGHANVGAVRG
jgi:hypothetical protein